MRLPPFSGRSKVCWENSAAIRGGIAARLLPISLLTAIFYLCDKKRFLIVSSPVALRVGDAAYNLAPLGQVFRSLPGLQRSPIFLQKEGEAASRGWVSFPSLLSPQLRVSPIGQKTL